MGGQGKGVPCRLSECPPGLGVTTVWGEGKESFQTLNWGDRSFAAKDKEGRSRDKASISWLEGWPCPQPRPAPPQMPTPSSPGAPTPIPAQAP